MRFGPGLCCLDSWDELMILFGSPVERFQNHDGVCTYIVRTTAGFSLLQGHFDPAWLSFARSSPIAVSNQEPPPERMDAL